MVFKERMWFPLIHTTITHISNFNLRSSRSPQIPFKNRDFTQPGVILNFTTNPINTNQCSGNHPPTKILDKRTTWILVKWHNSNMLRSQTSISDRLLKSLILSTNDLLIPYPIESWSSNKHDNQREWPSPRPPVNHKPDSIRIPTPASDTNHLALWASLSIEHNQRLTLPIQASE